MRNRVLILIMMVTIWQSGLSYSQKISIDSVHTCAGAYTVSVPVNVDNFNNIGAITLYIDFDTTVLKFDTIININSQLPGTIANKIPNKQKIGIVWSATSSGADLGAGKFCDLIFTVKKTGASALSFGAGCEIADFNADIINVTYKNGNVNVNPLPVVSFTGLSSNYCLSSLADTLTGVPVGGQFSGAGINGNFFNPSLAGTGTHIITYSYIDNKGCSNSATATVTVSQSLVVSITPSNPAICSGSTTTLTAQGAAIYAWTNGESTASITVSPTSTTTYTVIGTNGNSCQDTATAMVIVNPLPVITASVFAASTVPGPDTTWTIKNSGFTFNPASITISYGDSIRFQLGGSHNAVEVSQGTWNANGNTPLSGGFSTPFGGGFVTPVNLTVGTHYYVCAPHAGMGMKGIIIVTPDAAAVCAGTSVTLSGGGASTYTWSHGVSDGIGFIPTSTNTYTVTGTDVNGCSNTQSVKVIVIPNPVVTITSSDSIICSGGSVTLTAQGASAYQWSSGETTASIIVSPVSTAIYTVTGTSASGCTATQSIQIVINQNLVITITPSNPVICSGGTVTLTASGATTYLWSNGETTASIIVSPASTSNYTVTGTLGSCSGTQTTVVTINPNPVINVTPANTTICNGSSVTLTAQGASDYLWSNGETTSSIAVAPTSTITYTVTGTLGSCSDTQTAIVTVNPNPIVSITPPNPSICNGSSVTLTAQGTATYLWSNGETTASIIVSPASTTTYTVTGTDVNGCSNTQSVEVIINQNVVVTVIPSTSAICNGSTVTLTASGATNYLWSNGETTGSILVSPDSTTIFTVTGTLGNNCTGIQTTTVTVNPKPAISISPLNPAICNGGSVTLTVSGAAAYLWSTGETTASIAVSPTSTTTYTVAGTDANGCTNVQSVEVTVGQSLVVSITPSNPAICSGSAVTLTAQGAAIYFWSNGETTASITVSPTSTITYTVIGTNGNSCPDMATSIIIVNPLPVVTANAAGTVAGHNSTWIIKNAGTTFTPPAITINAGDSARFQLGSIHNAVEVSQATWNANGNTPLAGGFSTPFGGGLVLPAQLTLGVHYYVCVPHAGMGMKGMITVMPSSPMVCEGTSVTLSGGGASTYTWSHGVSDGIGFIPTSTNTYTVIGTDVNGCTNTQSVKVIVIPNPIVTITASGSTICNGGSVTLTGSGASTYQWSSGETTASIIVSPTATTNYTVTGINVNGCAAMQSVQVVVNQNLVIAIMPINPVICSGTSVTLTAQGASVYLWSDGGITSSIIVIPTSTTTYTVIGTSAGGCTATQTVQVTVNQNPVIAINPGSSTICNGSIVTLIAQGASAYLWSNGETASSIIVAPTSTATYTVTGTNTAGCKNSQSTTLTVSPQPTITVTPSNSSICNGSAVTLAANGASVYVWNTGATSASIVVTPTSTATYTVTGTNADGCTATQTAQVVVNQNPVITIIPANPTICIGSSIVVTAQGGSAYLWSNGETTSSITVAPTSITAYNVTGMNPEGCKGSQSTTVTVIPKPTITITPSNPSICTGSAVTLTASGASDYVWSTGATTVSISVSPSSSASYTVTGTNMMGCKNSQTTGVIVNPKPVIGITPVNPSICDGSTVTLTATGASTYVWNTGVTTTFLIVSPTSTTTYTVTGTNMSGCKNSQSAVVTVNPKPVIGITPSNPSICNGSTVTLTATGASAYVWNTGVTTVSLIVSPTVTTTYTVTGTNGNGCKNSQSGIVTVNPKPTITIAPANPSICNGSSVKLTANGAGNGGNYKWSTGAVTKSITVSPNATTTYIVMGTNSNGCTNTQSTVVTVNPTIVINPGSATICSGSVVTLTASGVGSGGSYKWSTGANTQSIIVAPASTTTYTVTGTNMSGCKNSQSAVVTVNPKPVIGITPSNPSICNGSTVTLTATGASAYVWNTGVTTVSLIVSPTVTTTYTVTGTNGNGCKNSQSGIVTVNPKPTITIAPANPSICNGSSVKLTANGAGNGGNYKWSTGAVTKSITVSPNATTTYIVMGTNSNGCTNIQSTVVTIITPSISVSPSTATICRGKTIILTANGAGNGGSYKWNTGAKTKSITVSPFLTTIYTVTGTNASGCKNSSSSSITVNNCHISENMGTDIAEQYFSINPNPAKNNFILDLHLIKESCYGKIEIMDMLGSKVKEVKQGMLMSGEMEINIKDLSGGIYYIQVVVGTDILIKKLIVN